MSAILQLDHLVYFVPNLEKATQDYREKWGVEPAVLQPGWVAFEHEAERIAFHRGKRKPRYDYLTDNLETAYHQLRESGWKVTEIKEIRGQLGFGGRDLQDNPILVRERARAEYETESHREKE